MATASVAAMKTEFAVVAKVRPTQAFDPEHGGFCSEHRYKDTTHVGTVVAPGKVLIRVGLCDDCANTWWLAHAVGGVK